MHGDFFILTHPNNLRQLEQRFSEDAGDRGLMPYFFGIEVRTDANMPERDIKQHWHPPEGDSFVEYEEGDYEWLERLGAGRHESIDHGPLFYQIQKPKFRVWMDVRFGSMQHHHSSLMKCIGF